MNRILDVLAAIGAIVLVLVSGWIILYPQRKRDEWVQIKRGRWIRK